MDSRLFRLPTTPNLYAPNLAAKPVDVDSRYSQVPTPNSRYPGWAAALDDARATTDYRPHCSTNVPAGSQFMTKAWMQKNGQKLIDVSRQRYAELTGSWFGLDPTVVPPAAMYVHCSENTCERVASTDPFGIGTERLDASAPALFGTFDMRASKAAPTPRIGLTTAYEGGRNSLRGTKEDYLE
jgi:hypothetical protein